MLNRLGRIVRVTPSRLRGLALATFLLVLVAGYLAWMRQVTVLADGRAHQLSTRAVSVGAALGELGIQLGRSDTVEPAAYMPLSDGLVIAVHRAAYVQLQADGETYSAVTAQKDPAALLAEFGLELGEGDRLLLAGKEISLDEPLPAAPILPLELRRPRAISVEVDGDTQQFTSSAPTLGAALAEHGLQLTEADRLNPPAETPLDAAIHATLQRARSLSISLGEQTLALYSAATTVGEALAEAGLALQGEDYSQPAEDQAVPADGAIRVVRVSESVELMQEALPHEIEWQPDAEADLDTISVVQLGQDGVRAARIRVRYEDGQEVARDEDDQRVLVEPITQINGYGTRIVIRTAVVDGVTIEYYRAVQVYATSYSPCRSGVPNQCFYGTSLGLGAPRKGIIATWYNWFLALGHHTVYVPGYGPGIIADVGAYPDRSLPWIDLAYSDSDYVAWGLVPVTMYFTTPVPPDVPLIWPP